jgi:hypothetical protein
VLAACFSSVSTHQAAACVLHCPRFFNTWLRPHSPTRLQEKKLVGRFVYQVDDVSAPDPDWLAGDILELLRTDQVGEGWKRTLSQCGPQPWAEGIYLYVGWCHLLQPWHQ